MKVLISAAETSSDVHGAEFLKALKEEVRARGLGEVDAFGIGGPRLQAEGLRTVVDARDLLVMGTSEILSRLPRILTALHYLVAAAEEEKPDLAFVIDYPDFHFRLAKRLRPLGIPLVYYIPPKVWIWRRWRIRFLREFFSKILCVFPFEEELYRRENVSARYIGNPLVEELPLTLKRSEARKSLDIEENESVLLLMLGSRPAEVKRHLQPMMDAALLVAKKLESRKLRVLVPLPETIDVERVRRKVTAHWGAQSEIEIEVFSGRAAECMAASDAGLVKSGTATLEAALMGCPHVVVYRPSKVTAWLFRNVMRLWYAGPVGLVNLFLGWRPGDPYVAREILCNDVTAESLAAEVLSLMTDSTKRGLMLDRFEVLKNKVSEAGNTPSRVAAQEVLKITGHLPPAS